MSFATWYRQKNYRTLSNPSRWEDLTNRSHREIRGLWANNKPNIKNTVSLKREGFHPEYSQKFKNKVSSLSRYIQNPTEAIDRLGMDFSGRSPIPEKSPRGAKISKSLRRYIKTNVLSNAFNNYLNMILEEQKGLFLTQKKLEVEISVSPESFVLLGETCIDRHSCFRDFCGNIDKYIVGMSQNTFTAWFYTKEGLQARLWGGFIPDKETFYTFNIYKKKTVSMADVLFSLHKTVDTILGKKTSVFHDVQDDFYLDRPYTNPDSFRAFYCQKQETDLLRQDVFHIFEQGEEEFLKNIRYRP